MPTLFILCGIPTAGKTTFAKNKLASYYNEGVKLCRIISRDEIREKAFDVIKYDDYKHTPENEKVVTAYFNFCLNKAIEIKCDIIIDKTNCHEADIDAIIKHFEGTNYGIKIKFFDIPLWKAWIRNKKRSYKENKTVPWSFIKQSKRNFKKINKQKYEHLVLK